MKALSTQWGSELVVARAGDALFGRGGVGHHVGPASLPAPRVRNGRRRGAGGD